MSAEDHAEVRQIIDSRLDQLQEWLDIRFRQQDELLRFISRDCKLRSNQESLASINVKENSFFHSDSLGNKVVAIDSDNETLSTDVILPPKDGRASYTASLEDLPLPGAVFEAYKDSQFQTHVASDRPSQHSEITFEYSKTYERSSVQTAPGGRWSSVQAATTSRPPGQDWQADLMDIFDQLDFDGSGSINCNELMEMFEEAEMPELQAFQVFKVTDSTGDGVINRVEWVDVIGDMATSSADEIKLLIAFLDRFTKSKRIRGSISKKERKRKPWLILRHDSPWRMGWDFMLVLLLFYVSVSVPFSLGFGQSKALKGIDLVIDILFCFDIMLNFRTSYMDADGSIVQDGKLIAMRYLKSWFVLDFVSSVPFDLITDGLLPNLTPARLIKIGKITKVAKLFRISKFMALAVESELMESVDYFLTSNGFRTFTRLTKLVLMMFIAAHWLACFGSAFDSSSIDAYFIDEVEKPGELKKYLAGMYWSMTTLSTVGYGDILPQTDYERAYAIIAMVIGGALYGYVIGSLTSIVTEMDVSSRAYNERMELIYSWLDGHDELPTHLRRRMRRHFKRALAAKSVMEDTVIVAELSPELRADTAFYLINEHVKRHAMFYHLSNSSLAKLVEVLRKSHVNAQEHVVQEGDPGIAMYILVDGLAKYETGMQWLPPDRRAEYDHQLSHRKSSAARFQLVAQGDSFGEEIIFELEQDYTYTIIALKECEFSLIGEDDFKERYQNMPELRKYMYEAFLKSRGARRSSKRRSSHAHLEKQALEDVGP